MRKSQLLTLVLLSLVLSACSILGHNSSQENAPTPPKNLTTTNSITTPSGTNAGNMLPRQAASGTKLNQTTPVQRIQENKSYGGEVDEVKVNNINQIPPYYIYPKGPNVDANAPSSDTVSTPSWKINW